MEVSLFRYLLLSTLWGALVWLLAREFAVNDFWVLVVGVLLLAVPLALAGLYGATVRQVRRLAVYDRRGWLYALLSGRTLRSLLWLLWALCGAFFLLLQFHTYTALDWFGFFLVVPVFFLVFSLCRHVLAGEVRPYLVTGTALGWARLLCPPLMLVLAALFQLGLDETPAYASLEAAVEAQRARVADMRGSALAAELSRQLAFYEGVKAYALGRLGAAEALWAQAIAAGLGLLVFHSACAMLSAFLIPGAEYRRVFAPLSESATPPGVGAGRTALWVAAFTFVALFVYLPLFAYLEAWMQQQPQPLRDLRTVEARVLPRLERIDEEWFREGTLAAVEEARLEALRQAEASLAELETRALAAFEGLEDNVDLWLDWYYSLVGEYARIAHLMSGELEDYMARKLEESLRQGDAFAEVQAALDDALAGHAEAQRLYRERVEEVMARNRVASPEGPVELVRSASLAEVFNPPAHRELVGLEQRLAASAGGAAVAGVVTTVVVQKVIGKVVGKNVFKLASKSLAKVVMGKAAGSTLGAGAGAGAGAAIGSVVPGIGTAIGAVVGGIIGGLAVGVTVDKMLIELEEAINREEFKAEILRAIREARDEFMLTLRTA